MDTADTDNRNTGDPAETPSALSHPMAVWAVFRTTGLDVLGGKKCAALILFAFLPVLLMLLARLFGFERGGGELFFVKTLFPVYHFINLIFFIFLGCSALGEGLEDKTITYDIICPVSRSAVYVGKFVSFLVSSLVVLLSATVVAYAVCMALFGLDALLRSVQCLVGVLAASTAGALVYGSFFMMLSVLIKRAVLVGIPIVLFNEILAFVPLNIEGLSIQSHLRNLATFISGDMRFLQVVETIKSEYHPGGSFFVLAALVALFLFGGIVLFVRKQLV